MERGPWNMYFQQEYKGFLCLGRWENRLILTSPPPANPLGFAVDLEIVAGRPYRQQVELRDREQQSARLPYGEARGSRRAGPCGAGANQLPLISGGAERRARVEEWGAACARVSFYANVHLKLSLVGFSGSWGRKEQPFSAPALSTWGDHNAMQGEPAARRRRTLSPTLPTKAPRSTTEARQGAVASPKAPFHWQPDRRPRPLSYSSHL